MDEENQIKDFSLGEKLDSVVNGVTSIAAELKSKLLDLSEPIAVPISELKSKRFSDRIDGQVSHAEGQDIGYDRQIQEYDNTMETQAEYDSRLDAPIASSSSFYEIKIEALSSGFLLKVGCQSVAVETPATLAKLIEIYLTDGRAAETRWYNTENKNVQKFIEKSLEDKQQ